jgi:hypothetical protein
MRTAFRWLFNKIADFIVFLMDWKMRFWFRMGWARPLKIANGKEKRS